MPEKPSIVKPALFGGIIMGVLFGVPYLNYANCACCAPVILGGFLSVFFYKKDMTPAMPPLTSSDGMRLGSVSGVIGGVLSFFLSQLFQMISDRDVRAELEQALEQAQGQGGEQILEYIIVFMDSPFFLFFSFLITVVLCVVFGLAGGLIGYSVFKPKPQMMNVNPPPANS